MIRHIHAKIRKQMVRFFFAGIGAVGTDTVVYFLLVHKFLNYVGHDHAKFISFLSGTLVAFIVNKFWTFESNKKSFFEIAAFLVLYLSTLVLNVSINHFVLFATDQMTVFAFLIATGCSTVANFLGQKYWVFRVSRV